MKSYYDFDLTDYNSYRIKSKCARAFFPENESELISLYNQLERHPVIIGRGNNIILSKSHYDEYFIIINGCLDTVCISNKEIIAGAGMSMTDLSEIALENSLSGFEIFYDIPSSVGGAIVMNAGSNEEDTAKLITKVRYLDTVNMDIKEIENHDIDFKYRSSIFQYNKQMIVLKAWFKLEYNNPEVIKEKMEALKRIRWKKQPREFPNCGSVFKRPVGYFVGPLIEKLGLKGYRIGGAMISEKHAGFIINYEHATGKDILNLISHIQFEVKDKYGINLEVEQQII